MDLPFHVAYNYVVEFDTTEHFGHEIYSVKKRSWWICQCCLV